MKKLIKAISALLVLALSITLVGCDNKKGDIEVGIILPTVEQNRWIQDKNQFEEMLDNVGFTSSVLFSQGSSITEKANVESLVEKNMKVLIISAQDTEAAADSIKAAKEAGVIVIAYDRLITNSDGVDYFVSFDSKEVGAAQAQYLVDHKPEGKGIPFYLYTGLPSDSNSFLFFEGSWPILQPYFADGTFVIANCPEANNLKDKKELTQEEEQRIIMQVSTDWLPEIARSKAESHLAIADKSMKGDVLILSPNDGSAVAISDVFSQDPDIKSFIITGQDADLDSVGYIIEGKQSMTVMKNTNKLATEACNMAMKILKGEEVEINATSNNGKLFVPTLQIPVDVVTADNYMEKLVDTGYYTLNQINAHR
ncbi:MAG: sugar-binding protein [Clostridia bacterium]|nr:sugar-binding protein [Clostridia bacterium]